MKDVVLGRAFRRILAASLPVPGAIVWAACSSASAPNNSPGTSDATTPDSASEEASDLSPDTSPGDAPEDTSAPEAGPDDASYIVTSCGERIATNAWPYGDCGAPQCFALEAGALDGGDGGRLFHEGCAPLCGAGTNFFSCEVERDAASLVARCQPDCTGRRPAGLLESDAAVGAPLGAYFAEMARLEAASVHAFQCLRRELVAHRAPRRLVRAAERAARDEVRHARMTRALAYRYGGGVRGAEVVRGSVRSLAEIAIENAVEGCVREAFGALVATWQAQAAKDLVVRAAMARIARDETRHAALAFDLHAWLHTKLDASTRARVDEAREAALGELVSRRYDDTPPELRAALGLPTGDLSRVLARHMRALS